MRPRFLATPLAAVIALPALAQTAVQTPDARPAAPAYLVRGEVGDIHVSEMIGATLYAADAGETTIASRDAWEGVGVVNDLLMTREGRVRAILVDVGTFLGMGGKTIAAPLAEVRYVTEGPDGEYFLVIMADRKTLQGAPAYERPEVRAEEKAMSTANPTIYSGSPFTYEGYARAENHALTVRDLEKADVYGRGEKSIGSVSSLLVTKEGKITDAIVDVGGFLGIGAHPVRIPFADLTVLRKTGGSEVRVYMDATKEKLEAMPRYAG